MSRLVVLRPEPGASETVKRAEAQGWQATSIRLFEIEPVDWDLPAASSFDGLLLTSANAVQSGGDKLTQLRGLPVHAVGKATAEAARQAGFDIKSTGDSGVERLLGSLEADLKLLHLCGEHLAPAGHPRQMITAIPVYRSVIIEPAPRIASALGAIVLIHSPRAGQRFAELAAEQRLDRQDVRILAISDAAAEAVGGDWKRVAAADQPTDDALLALAEQLCDNRRQG
jgi:uroporphyrinogen-III synthase